MSAASTACQQLVKHVSYEGSMKRFYQAAMKLQVFFTCVASAKEHLPYETLLPSRYEASSKATCWIEVAIGPVAIISRIALLAADMLY